MCVRAPGVSREMREKPEHTQLYHSGWMFPIKQLNQPPNDSFHRHLGNYRSLLFTSGDRTTGWGAGGCLAGNAKTEQKVRECKTKRQEWRRRSGCNKLSLAAAIALVREKLHFHWANESQVCEWRKQSWLIWKNKRRRQKMHAQATF